MALPKVTPGTYNYGEYANPTPIKYNTGGKAALGAGIASAITSIAGAAIEKKQEEKRKKQAADKIFTDTFNRFDKETRNQFAGQVMDQTDLVSQAYLDFKNGIIDAKQLAVIESSTNDNIANLTALKNIEEGIDLDNIDFGSIKMNEQNIENFYLQKSLENNTAKYIYDKKNNEWTIEYNSVNIKDVNVDEIISENGIPEKYFRKKTIPLNELISNSKNFFKLDTKIQLADEPVQNLFTALANNFNKSQGRIYMTNVSENGYELLDEGKAIEGFRNSSDVDVVYTKFGKDIAEDILDLEYNPEDPEQVDQIKTFIAQQAVAKADKTGNKVPKPREQKMVDPIEERTGMDLQDRAIAFDQITALKPGEQIEIKYKGSNDFKKENYIIARSSEGDLVFTKDEEGATPSVISQQDLIKEFGVGSLINLQRAQQAGIKF